MRITLKILPLALALLLSVSLFAQRKANKQYEIEAYNLAVESYLNYLDRNPTDGEAMARLADSYRHLNILEDAAEWYERAVQQMDIDPIHYLNYGKVLKGLRRYEDAKRWFLTYATTNPTVGNHFAQTADYATRTLNAPPSYQVFNEQAVNTPASEFGPAFYGNNEVVFSSSRIDANPNGNFSGKVDNQLFVAKRGNNNFLQNLELLQPDDRNKRYSEGPVSYSADGRLVAITRNNFADGTRHLSSSGMELSLYFADVRQDGSWGNLQSFPYNSSDFSNGFPNLAADGNTLYFASNRPGGQGGFDIYVSYRTGSNWSTPENLGAGVNTPGDEITPHFDGRTLYFSSTWHEGFGGYDIFKTEKENGQWTRAINLGPGANSSYDDHGFVYDNIRNVGYLSSNRQNGSVGAEDIYRIVQRTDQLVLRAVNATDQRPLSNVVLDFSSCGQGIYQTDRDGMYVLQAYDGIECQVSVRKPGFLPRTITLTNQDLQRVGEYEIALSSEDEGYIGTVVDAQTNAPLSNVTVQTIDQRDGRTLEVTTDQSGEYIVAFQPNTLYMIRYSKSGYETSSRSIPVGPGTNKAVLGTYALPRGADFNDVMQGNANNNGGTTTPTSPTNTGNLPEVGYAVQVAAVEKLEPEKYANLSSFGNIYYAIVDGVYKVRVGVYPYREEAEEAVEQVQRKGYQGAFLVQENARDVADKFLASDFDSKGPAEVRPTAGTAGNYKVRLAALKNANNFDASKVNSIGTVERRNKGQWTIILVGDFTSTAAARSALRQAQSAGFKDAYIVVVENSGELTRVNL